MAYVYELIDPRSGVVFYVGKGKHNRVDAHEKEARAGKRSAKCDLIRDIVAEGLSIEKRVVASFATDQEAFDAEEALISRYGLENLTNIAPGGGTARHDVTRADDRSLVAAIAEFMNRTKGGEIRSLLVAGRPLDLTRVAEDYRARIVKVVRRRGLDWVNHIAERFAVRFAHGEA